MRRSFRSRLRPKPESALRWSVPPRAEVDSGRADRPVRDGVQEIQALGRGRAAGTKRQPKRGFRKRFQTLFTISTLSTGLDPNISLPRLDSDVHGAQVIGTAVPASPEGSATTRKGAAGDQRSDLRRQAMVRTSVLVGASREEAPEEKSSCRATRLPVFFGILVSEAGHDRGFPKKGRGTSGGFD